MLNNTKVISYIVAALGYITIISIKITVKKMKKDFLIDFMDYFSTYYSNTTG